MEENIVLQPTIQHFDLILVALSYVVSVVGSFTALRLARQIPMNPVAKRLPWIIGAAFAVGGGGVWSMHFIGMLAFDMGMTMTYDLAITLLSLLLVVVMSGVGFFIVGQAKPSLVRYIIGGTLMGLGVATMHYTGMAAMNMRARITYDMPLFWVSIAIAVTASTVALWLAFRVRNALEMVGAALVMGIAVCGMHYVGMFALKFELDLQMSGPGWAGLPAELLGYLIFLVTLVILTIGLVVGSGRREDFATG